MGAAVAHVLVVRIAASAAAAHNALRKGGRVSGQKKKKKKRIGKWEREARSVCFRAWIYAAVPSLSSRAARLLSSRAFAPPCPVSLWRAARAPRAFPVYMH